MTDTSEPSLDGVRVWFVTDGTAESAAWLDPFVGALRDRGAASVDVLGVSGLIGQTARGLIGQGAERIARTLRFVRRGRPDASAFEVIADSRPQVVIVDHPGVLRTLDVVRDASGTDAVHIGLVAGFAGLADWAAGRADAYVAADSGVLDALRRPGIADAALQLGGPPVPFGFARDLDRDALRAELGFGDDTVVMVDAVGMDAALIDAVMAQLARQGALRAVFHYGSDRLVADTLRNAAAARGVRADMFGHVDDIESFAVAADLVLVGPTAAGTAAYLTLGVPVVALDPSLASLAAAQGGGLTVCHDGIALGSFLSGLAAEGALAGLRDAASAGRDAGANAAAALAIARIWAARDALTAELNVRPAQAAADDAPRSSRFESIGGPVPATPARPLGPMSREQAREALASLILDERRIEGDIASFASDRDRWLERLQLAEDGGEQDLVEFASGNVRDLTARISGLNDQMAAIQEQKADIRRRVAAASKAPAAPMAPTSTASSASGPTPDDYEARFRRLEREGKLDRLRRQTFGDE